MYSLFGDHFLEHFFEDCSSLLKVNPERIPMENEGDKLTEQGNLLW